MRVTISFKNLKIVTVDGSSVNYIYEDGSTVIITFKSNEQAQEVYENSTFLTGGLMGLRNIWAHAMYYNPGRNHETS